MKCRKIDKNRFIVYANNKYYIVNNVVRKFLEAYYDDNNLYHISKKMQLPKLFTKQLSKIIMELMDECNYYDNNLDLNFPLKLQWKITNKCNLKCSHCYLGNLSNELLSPDKLMKIVNKIVKTNIFEVTISGGEALLVSNLPLIVQNLINNNIKVNIFTNGMFLEDFLDKIFSKFNYHPSSKLQFFVSIDGEKETHEKIRGIGTFDKTINGIIKAIEYGYNITTNTVLSSINYTEIHNLYKFLLKIGVNKIQISNIIIDGNATENLRLNKNMKKHVLEGFKTILKDYPENRLLYAEMPDDDCSTEVMLLSNNKKINLGIENWKCSAGIGKATIDYDGSLYCCPFMTGYCLGNVLDNDISTLWKSPNRFKFLKILAEKNNNSRVCIVAKGKGVKK
ncbi:MAG: radical SAM protein [Bacilli bacterium]